MSSIKTSEVGLTIATTTGCNFKCPYCYEEGVKSINMSQDVEDAIVKYIETVKKPIDITWYGGEPLINWATIQRLTQKISEIKPKEMVKYAFVTNGYSLTPGRSVITLLMLISSTFKLRWTELRIHIISLGYQKMGSRHIKKSWITLIML